MANIANLPVSNSLVKYGNPVLVSTSGKKNLKDTKGKKEGKGPQGLD